MISSVLVLVGIGCVTYTFYGIGQLSGYDKWDKENETFQKGLKKCK